MVFILVLVAIDQPDPRAEESKPSLRVASRRTLWLPGAGDHHHVVCPAAGECRIGRGGEGQQSFCKGPWYGEVRADRGRIAVGVDSADLYGEVVPFCIFGLQHDPGERVAVRVGSRGEGLSVVLVGDNVKGIAGRSHDALEGGLADRLVSDVREGFAQSDLPGASSVDVADLDPDLLALLAAGQRVRAGVGADVCLEGGPVGGVAFPLVVQLVARYAVPVAHAGRAGRQVIPNLRGAGDEHLAVGSVVDGRDVDRHRVYGGFFVDFELEARVGRSVRVRGRLVQQGPSLAPGGGDLVPAGC